METFHILNDMSPGVLSDLVRIRDCFAYNFRYQKCFAGDTNMHKRSFRFYFVSFLVLQFILKRKRELVSLLLLSYECLVAVDVL